MIEVNKKFIEACQVELDKKKDIFIGDLNYENMPMTELWKRLFDTSRGLENKIEDYVVPRKLIKRYLCHIANYVWMLWERLEE